MRKIIVAAAVLAMAASAAHAQDAAGADSPSAAKLKELQEQNALIEARATLEKTERERIAALGIPSFAGTAELKEGGGSLEAALLTSIAIEKAAVDIVKVVSPKRDAMTPKKNVIVLAGAETFDLGIASTMTIELKAIEQLFKTADATKPSSAGLAKAESLTSAGTIAIVNAVAGLFRSEVQVSAATVKIDDATLAAAVAGRLGGTAYLPSQAVGDVPLTNELVSLWAALAPLRTAAAKDRASLGEKPDATNKAWAAALDAAVAAFDSFNASATKIDASGTSPLVRAARLQALGLNEPFILRVYAVFAGGSIVNTKNLFTTFGVDPLKVSGGLIARYTLTALKDGEVEAAGVLSCRTSLARLRAIQEKTWAGSSRQATAQCFPVD